MPCILNWRHDCAPKVGMRCIHCGAPVVELIAYKKELSRVKSAYPEVVSNMLVSPIPPLQWFATSM
jgi:hypothetical protein